MAEEKARKTLANCKNSEFLKRAMEVRKMVCEYYGKIDVKSIAARYKDKYADKNETAETVREFILDVISAIFAEHPVETVKLVAIAGFMTEDEAESIAPSELFGIFLECALSERVLDFFINVERSAGSGMDGILAAFVTLKVIAGGMTTSAQESQNSMTDTAEKSPAGDTAVSA